MHETGGVRAADYNLSLAHHTPRGDTVDDLQVFGQRVLEIAGDIGTVLNKKHTAAVAPDGLKKGLFANRWLKMNLRDPVALTHDWKPLPSTFFYCCRLS